MSVNISERIRQSQASLHQAALGMTLGLGAYFAGAGARGGCAGGACPASAACPTEAVCWARLPILALPLLADGAVLIAGKMLARGETLTRDEKVRLLE